METQNGIGVPGANARSANIIGTIKTAKKRPVLIWSDQCRLFRIMLPLVVWMKKSQ
jgi:hypothetical protein